MEMQEMLRQILNGQTEITQRFDQIDQRFDQIDQRFDRIEDDIAQVKRDQIDIHQTLHKINVRLDRIEVQQNDEVKTLYKEIWQVKKIFSPEVIHAMKESV